MPCRPPHLLRPLAPATWWVGCLVLCTGCSARDVIADLRILPRDGGPDSTLDGNLPAPTPDARQAFCEGGGVSLPLAGQVNANDATCGGFVASQTFRQALCSCSNLDFIGVLKTDEFDSDLGPYVELENDGGPEPARGTLASVYVNASMTAPAGLDLGGSLTVAGANGLTLPASSPSIATDLRVHGDLAYVGTVAVGRDVWVEGNLQGGGSLDIGRHLRQPMQRSRIFVIEPNVAGKDLREDFSIDTPCPCKPEQRIDVAAVIAAGQAHSDNLELGLHRDVLKARVADTRITLACGRYVLSEVSGKGKVELTIEGRTALFILGDFVLSDDFEIVLEPGASLDVLVLGNLDLANAALLGDLRHPAGVRFYVAGMKPIELIGELDLGLNLYAPNVDVTLAAGLSAYGSIFAGNLSALGDFSIHYDTAITRAGDACVSLRP